MSLSPSSWLLCIHNIPPKPAYLRAKAARRLAALGAVAVKNAVYVLPDGAAQREGLVWLAQEIEQGGGRAYVCGANFSIAGGGIDDAHIRSLFVSAREADYRGLLEEFQPGFLALGDARNASEAQQVAAQEWLARLRERFEALLTIDFFGAPGREAIEDMLAGTGRWLQLASLQEDVGENIALDVSGYTGRTWVTRPGVHVDRIASAWLIQRFIDPKATFRFATAPQTSDDIRFDMPEAEFTHMGNQCTFEVMVQAFALTNDPSLRILCDIVRDIDLHETPALRHESAGVSALLHGISLQVQDDLERISRGGQLLNTLYEHFKRN